MSEVSVEIDGRKYRMACEDGQEAHLTNLARRFDEQVKSFKTDFGEIGDIRLTVMAGIAVMDSLVETERQLAVLKSELGAAVHMGESLKAEKQALEQKCASLMEEAAAAVDQLAQSLESDSQ